MKIKIIFFKNYSTKSKNKKKSYLKRTLNLFVTTVTFTIDTGIFSSY